MNLAFHEKVKNVFRFFYEHNNKFNFIILKKLRKEKKLYQITIKRKKGLHFMEREG
jgi:hypothetical protein